MTDRLRAALEDLESWLTSIDYPGVAGLLPGLPEAEVRSALAAVGLDPPDDVITFFGWHDGYHQEVADPTRGWFGRIHPSWSPLSLEEAIASFLELREGFELDDDLDGTCWLPVLQADAFWVVVDCREDLANRGRVAVFDLFSLSPVERPSTLAEPFEGWVRLFRSGRWTLNPETGRFTGVAGADTDPWSEDPWS